MTETKLLKEIEKVCVNEIVKTTNQLLGQNKAAFLAAGLFLDIPVRFSLLHNEDVTTDKLSITELNENTCVSFNREDSVVEFEFIVNGNKPKTYERLLKVITKHPMFFGYHYTKQLVHLIRGHHTAAHQQMMFRKVMSKKHGLELVEVANTMSVNTFMRDLISVTDLSSSWHKLEKIIPNVSGSRTEIELLDEVSSGAEELIVKKARGNTQTVTYTDLTFVSKPVDYSADTKAGVHTPVNHNKASTDRRLSTLSAKVTETIGRSGGMQGTGVGALFKTLFDLHTVNAVWFEDLESSFGVHVDHKTEESYRSFKGVNGMYRHIYTAPIEVNIQKKISLILSVDTSGSMNIEDLVKVSSLIKSYGHKISNMHVLTHTTAVIKESSLSHDEDISMCPEFKEVLSCRHGYGGTSHKDVFKHIQNLADNGDEEIEQYLYISFSDNYSDIESFILKYPAVEAMDKIWLYPKSGARLMDEDIVGGRQISL